jgi:hypothetical protein
VLYLTLTDFDTQLTSGQCPDRKPGTAPEVRELLEQMYPAMVMNIATSNVDGGNITVSLFNVYCSLRTLIAML